MDYENANGDRFDGKLTFFFLSKCTSCQLRSRVTTVAIAATSATGSR